MLTQKKLDSLKPKAKEYNTPDRDGLSIRMRPSGSMSWVCRYTYLNKQDKVTIGKYNQKKPEAAWTLIDARERLLRFRAGQIRALTQKKLLLKKRPPRKKSRRKPKEPLSTCWLSLMK